MFHEARNFVAIFTTCRFTFYKKFSDSSIWQLFQSPYVCPRELGDKEYPLINLNTNKTKQHMKNFTKLFVLAIVMIGFTVSANAQSSASASTTATLITPISIVKTADMNFGTVAASSTSGTIVLDAVNGVAAAGGSFVVNAASASTAVFDVTGEGTSSFSISYPASVTLTRATGTEVLTVDSFTNALGASSTLTAGAAQIKLGATLNIPADAVAGTYTNPDALTVTVNYN
jgi:hypothetical protein